MRFLAAALSAMLLVGCDSERVQVDADTKDFLSVFNCPTPSGAYLPATIAELIANPGRFDGKAVKVSGYYLESLEHSAIYPILQDPLSVAFSDGIWTLVSIDLSPSSGDHVVIRGVFTTTTRGHLGQWPGSICVHSVKAGSES